MPTKKKKRRAPLELVTSARKTGSWYDRLSDIDMDYVDQVVNILQCEPHTSVRSVAISLIKELDIKCCVKAVEDKLRKMAT